MKQIREQVGEDLAEFVDSREGKLPVWAQELLTKQRREIAQERLANAALRGDVGDDSDVCVQNVHSPDQPLPRGARVAFTARPDREIVCRMRDGQLSIHTSGGSLAISPQSSNAINLTITER